MLALSSVTEEESWVASVKGGNSLHPAEPGLAFPEPASGDKETAGEMHHSETHMGVSPEQQQQRRQLIRSVTRASLRASSPVLCLIVAPRELTVGEESD